MRIADRYIGRQVLLGTLYAVLVLCLVLVLGNLFKKIQPLLVDQKAPLELVLRFVINVLPLSLIYTVPWGFLSAVLLVFGRLSSNHEITSFRVAGLSLVRLAAPVFVIGALLSLVSLWLNTSVVPRSMASSMQLIYDQARRDPDSLLKPGVVQGNFQGDGNDVQKVLIEGKSGEWVEGFHYYQLPASAEDDRTYVHAARAALAVDEINSQLRVKLEDAYFETHKPDGRIEMAFAGKAEPLLIDLKSQKNKKVRAGNMTNDEILQPNSPPTRSSLHARKLKLRSEITRRYSFSMASLAFAFIAVPLGSRVPPPRHLGRPHHQLAHRHRLFPGHHDRGSVQIGSRGHRHAVGAECRLCFVRSGPVPQGPFQIACMRPDETSAGHSPMPPGMSGITSPRSTSPCFRSSLRCGDTIWTSCGMIPAPPRTSRCWPCPRRSPSPPLPACRWFTAYCARRLPRWWRRFFAASRHTIMGPTNATAFMLFSFFSVNPALVGRWGELIPLLVLMVGLIATFGSLLRVADLMQFVSRSVLVGYISGAAVLILANQTDPSARSWGIGSMGSHPASFARLGHGLGEGAAPHRLGVARDRQRRRWPSTAAC